MNEIKIFRNEEFGEIRTVIIDGEPWFVGKDISIKLGYSDPKDAIRKHVDAEDKQLIQKGQIATLEIPNRGINIINESGLYALIFGSKLESANRFKHWVTSEILPSIRKHGVYMTNEVIERTLTDPDYLIQLATALKEERQARKLAEEKIERQKRKR
jgi:anti-repressor protein